MVLVGDAAAATAANVAVAANALVTVAAALACAVVVAGGAADRDAAAAAAAVAVAAVADCSLLMCFATAFEKNNATHFDLVLPCAIASAITAAVRHRQLLRQDKFALSTPVVCPIIHGH